MTHRNPGSILRPTDRRGFLRTMGAGALAVAAGPTLIACGDDSGGGATAGGGGGGKLEELAFSHANSGTPVATAVQRFAEKRADEVGAELLAGNPQLKVETQIQEVETWITQGVNAMCVFPVTVEAFEPLAKRARDAGIVFTTYAVELENSDGAVLFSNEQSGEIIGKHAVKWINENLGGEGEVLLLGAGTASPDLLPRIEIPKKMIQEQTNAKVVAEQDGVDPTAGLNVAETVLRSHPNMNIVIGLNDDGALGAARAFQNAGKDPAKTYVGGQDGALDALKAIEKGGHFKATAALSLKDIGVGVVDLNEQIVTNGAKGKKNLEVPPRLVAVDEKKYLQDSLAEWS
jgi:ABC-type sugar transport system substrate-binding protein